MSQQNKKMHKAVIAIVGVLVLIISVVLSFILIKNFTDQPQNEKPILPNTNVYPQSVKEETIPEGEWVVAPDMPRYMTIDKLGIWNARVVELGIKSGTENQLDDPKNIHDVGWYNKSVKPGFGSTSGLAGLYDGHNTGYNTSGVFINLSDLSVGDLIKIERGDGQIFYYEVREVQTPLLEDVEMAKMQKSVEAGVEGLNIISCSGQWDEARNTYTHRTTIRAVLQ